MLLQLLPLPPRCTKVQGSEASSSHYGNLQTSEEETHGQNKRTQTNRNTDGWTDEEKEREREEGKATGRNIEESRNEQWEGRAGKRRRRIRKRIKAIRVLGRNQTF